MTDSKPSNPMRDHGYFAASVQDTLSQLGASRDKGLTSEEATRRLEIHGLNQLQGKRAPSFLLTVFRQLRSFLILILIAAVLVSVWVGNWIEAGVILFIILLNALVGALQE
ncbi:MAG: hypothetical protein E4H08_11170, partial [Candidatus Atribacteria bacterium]